MFDVAAQLIGLLASAIVVFSFQIKSSNKLIFVQGIGATLFAVHFGMMGATMGMLLNILTALRNVILASNFKFSNSHIIKWITIIASVGFLFFDNKGYASLFPVIALTIGTYIFWTRDSKKIRYAQILCISPMWLLYGITYFSIASILTETFNICSTIISLFRLRSAKTTS